MGYDMTAANPRPGIEVGFRPHDEHDDDPAYFRLNIWGMGLMREVMSRVGVFETVPLEKFCSNDGWHVQADECRTIAEALRGASDEAIEAGIEADDARGAAFGFEFASKDTTPMVERVADWREVVEDFASYCERCADFGDGFRVY